MSEKRRDNKNRILRIGESQRSDGRYRFKYVDINGDEKNVYSWRLDRNDPVPKGKKRDLSLREKEALITQDNHDGIVPKGGNYTVLTWLVKLQQVDGKGYSSIHTIRGVLRPAFDMALADDLIRKNPFEFKLVSVVVNDSVTRDAITRKQERDLLKFIKEDRHFSRYYDTIYILFNTGVRISEFCGLTNKEIEFDKMRIKIDHQLQRTPEMEYIIEEPKSEHGNRYVPMTKEVEECFRNLIANRKKPVREPVIDGYSGFLCLDKNDMPMVALHWEKYLEHIIEKYNKIYKIEMPKVTPHVCRHTFCSKMASSGMNPKTLQYIMGHADISVTLNTYTHVGFDDAQSEMNRICACLPDVGED